MALCTWICIFACVNTAISDSTTATSVIANGFFVRLNETTQIKGKTFFYTLLNISWDPTHFGMNKEKKSFFSFSHNCVMK